MMHCDSVDVVRESQAEISHIQGGDGATVGNIQHLRPIRSEDLSHQSAGKLIMPGGNGRVSCEDALPPNLLNVGFRGRPQLGVSKTLLKQREREQRSVSFIQMKNRNVHVPQSTEHFDAANAENCLLAETIACIASV